MSPVRWLGGALRLRVEGAAERFLNLCRGRDLAVWDIRRVDETALTCRMHPRALRVLRRQRRRHGCRITVLEKAGLPFALQAVRRRWTLPVAALLWACLLMLASTRVWAITV
jgi:similar to stage IV sporulation protein